MKIKNGKSKIKYYAQRIYNMFVDNEEESYKLSRSKIEIFVCCQRCFYLDRKCGTKQPPMYPYTLNNAVDRLLKNEFDQYRAINQPHPYLIEHGIDAIPFNHELLNNWRMNQRGVQYYHAPTNFMVTGAVDDVWINSQGELIVVDYKATSTQGEVSLDDRDSYKRQMEIYQWLLRKNGFKVSNTAYFVYCNGEVGQNDFNEVLQFKVSLIPYEGDDSWIEQTLLDIKDCLALSTIPVASVDCNYCNYWMAVDTHIKKHSSLPKIAIRFGKQANLQKIGDVCMKFSQRLINTIARNKPLIGLIAVISWVGFATLVYVNRLLDHVFMGKYLPELNQYFYTIVKKYNKNGRFRLVELNNFEERLTPVIPALKFKLSGYLMFLITPLLVLGASLMCWRYRQRIQLWLSNKFHKMSTLEKYASLGLFFMLFLAIYTWGLDLGYFFVLALVGTLPLFLFMIERTVYIIVYAIAKAICDAKKS